MGVQHISRRGDDRPAAHRDDERQSPRRGLHSKGRTGLRVSVMLGLQRRGGAEASLCVSYHTHR